MLGWVPLHRDVGVRRPSTAMLALAAGLAACTRTAQTPLGPVPVQVGGDQYDACASLVGGLSFDQSGAVAVRSGPGDRYPVVGELRDTKGQTVLICDSAEADEWKGIVYTLGDAQACDLSHSQPDARTAYAGPCTQGWIRSSAIAQTVD